MTRLVKWIISLLCAKPAANAKRAVSPAWRRAGAIIALDLAVLVELATAVYRANEHPSDFTGVFLKTFFGLLIPTLLLWWYGQSKVPSQKCEQQGTGGSMVGGEPS